MYSIIKSKLQYLTNHSGVYQMFDKHHKIIYIGKAKNLKKRVTNYFNSGGQDNKTIAMVNKVCDFKVIVVETETKALLLENELIKQHKPKYNILLKDSKSYPYIFISKDKHPRVGLYRGVKNNKNKYFGPYPSVDVMRESLTLLKKIFKIRGCANSVYKGRSRPCLEYQIGLCSAPCVDKIPTVNYQKDVYNLEAFLLGKSKEVLAEVERKMQFFAAQQEFEMAAHFRDQLIKLRKSQEQHNTQANADTDFDFVHLEKENNINCIQILFVRNGKQIDNQHLFPKNATSSSKSEILSAFLPLYYSDRIVPKTIVVSCKISDKVLIEKTLLCKIINRLDKSKKHFMNIASLTAKQNLQHFVMSKNRRIMQLSALKQVLNMDNIPSSIECFDISHNHGEATIASCVVFLEGLPSKKNYRSFNIKNITKGDDYAAMRQVIYRRYSKLKNRPNLVLIDGGLGQLNQAIMVFDSLGIDDCLLVGVAKGEGRKAGLETLILREGERVKKIKLKPTDIALTLVNYIRDEAHRFAITKHRKKFEKTRNISILEHISGIGVNKRKNLINYFGGLEEVKKAGANELMKVNGINLTIATKIVNFFHKV